MIRRLLLDRSGASAAEFGLLVPLVVVLLLGVFDVGRFLYDVNQAEKATQMGARTAIVTDPVPGGLATTFVGRTVGGVTLTQGDRIPAAALTRIDCIKPPPSGPVECSGQPGDPGVGTINAARFDAIVARMQAMKPDITAANVTVSYRGSGLGFAGDPNGMDIAPLVTVELSGVQFRPTTGLMFLTFNLPAFRTTLTAEDSAGTDSN